MANFYEGGLDTFNAITQNIPHPNTLNFLQQMVQAPTRALTAAAQEFMGMGEVLYDRLMGSTAMRTARAAVQQISSHWQANEIHYIDSVAGLQTAPPIMHRWLMACPELRVLYHKNLCDGYQGSYVDAEPGKVGEAHRDYRLVMDGIVTEQGDDWGWTEYLEIPEQDEVPLLSEQQFDIIRSWMPAAMAVFERKDDPTSKWNASLS